MDDNAQERNDGGYDEAPSKEQDADEYEYEETPEPEPSERGSKRNVARRNVLTADEAVYNVSYHPGRVVSTESIFLEYYS